MNIMFRYHISTTGHSSARYGPCEICGEHVSEVFCQREEQTYDASEALQHIKQLKSNGTYKFGTPSGWTERGCFSYFGHRSCLEGKQRESKQEKVAPKPLLTNTNPVQLALF